MKRDKLNRLFNNRYIRIDLSKNTKFFYYLHNISILLTPHSFYKKNLKKHLQNKQNISYIQTRTAYYNKLQISFQLGKDARSIKQFAKIRKKTYFFDTNKYLKYFDNSKKFHYLFGDITHIPEHPSFVKSRPIEGNNENSILLNLNKVRHFIFLNDKLNFSEKKNCLMWRGRASQLHRQIFLKKFYNHLLCDVGQVQKRKDKHTLNWQKPKLSIKQQLTYKFILAIEGNDVASNLKWAMSSNSLVFMTKPRYETWFMEGTLIADYHYVQLKEDYTDLEEKIYYYSKHLEKALYIINNAHDYIKQFKNSEQEDRIALQVLDKYFQLAKDYHN